jgi:hypothetical protein
MKMDKIRKAGHIAKEAGKYLLDPYYSKAVREYLDPVRYYASPLARDLAIITAAEGISIATTGRPIQLDGMNPLAAYVLSFEGLLEGAAVNIYDEFRERRRKASGV